MQVNTYLFFNGHCEEAFKFYEQVPRREDRGHDYPRRHAGRRARAGRVAE